jgi:hypothetical protein
VKEQGKEGKEAKERWEEKRRKGDWRTEESEVGGDNRGRREEMKD